MTLFEFIVPLIALAVAIAGTIIIHFRYKALLDELEMNRDESKTL